MTTSSSIFDNSMPQWLDEQNQPWGKLKYKLVHSNLTKHFSGHQMTILDAGGGNGFDSIPFAQQGHLVEIVDYSKEMLAEAQKRANSLSIEKNVKTHFANALEIQNLFPVNHFDLVVCHNVLQYVEDVSRLLHGLVNVLKPGGLISIIGTNRYSAPYHAAFLRNNLAEALTELNTRNIKGTIFETKLVTYSVDEIIPLMKKEGCVIEEDYGIRCMCDYWGDNETKSDSMVLEKLEKLEFSLTDKHPYKLLARFFQVIARKA